MFRTWIRAVDGRWIGIVDFSISDSNGGNVTAPAGVPVAAEALTEFVFPLPLIHANPELRMGLGGLPGGKDCLHPMNEGLPASMSPPGPVGLQTERSTPETPS